MILFVLLFVHRVSLEVSETILSAQSPELVAEKLADQRCTKGRITPHTGTLNLGSTAAIVFSLVSIYIETVRQCFWSSIENDTVSSAFAINQYGAS